MEEFFNQYWFSLPAAQVGSQTSLQLNLAARRRQVLQVGFDRVIQILIGIQFGTVGWKIKNLDPIAVGFNPAGYFFSMVHSQIIHNEKDFSFGSFDKQFHIQGTLVNPNVSKSREVMKSKAQTGNRRGSVVPYVTKRFAGWNAAMGACRF